ncbi:hypothetical protein [Halomonas salipaludis]|uniref:Peptidase C-terminal archaeal/bacterial domain-containing protein n=1 Tax=Halomonas salipaludis TaxID=2032625 RepID=A0A2A2ESA1_9GAMM|nr:hypothetical protein [Halomonas salipaludis]PAU75163.1 hypothetical protein CK498_18620 [Halomonas salipaludis]
MSTFTIPRTLLLGLMLTAGFGASYADDSVDAPAPQVAALGERLTGEITSADELNGKDGSFYQRHHLMLEAGSVVEFELGGALRGSLSLFAPDGEWLAASGDDAGAKLRQRIAEDGNHVLVVSGEDARSFGPYRLDSRQLETRSEGDITAPIELTGWLDGDSNRYRLQIEEAGLYVIEMRSHELDAYLELTGPDGFAVSDDDSGQGLDARLTALLDTGDYTLVARAAHGYGQGIYSLDISAQAMPDDSDMQNGGPLDLDTQVSGWFYGQDIDYQITLSERLEVVIDMQSEDFDSYLTLTGDGVTISDDDSGSDLDARLQTLLDPGQYTISAGSFGSGSGRFRLATRTQAVTDDEGSELSLDEPRTARLVPGARDHYTLQIETPGMYVIDMRSSEVDAYLEIEGEELYLSDDDSGDGVDAQLTVRLEAGHYRVTARAFNSSDVGSYVISVTQP